MIKIIKDHDFDHCPFFTSDLNFISVQICSPKLIKAMKTREIRAFLLTAFLIVINLSATAQEMSRQDYLDKSKRQKTTAFILLGGGVALSTLGFIIFPVETAICPVPIGGVCPDPEETKLIASGILIYGGALAALGSIPLFISSNKNAKKAAQLSFKNEPTYIPKYAGNIPRSVPSITLTIPL